MDWHKRKQVTRVVELRGLPEACCLGPSLLAIGFSSRHYSNPTITTIVESLQIFDARSLSRARQGELGGVIAAHAVDAGPGRSGRRAYINVARGSAVEARRRPP